MEEQCLINLIDMVSCTNIVALDKTLYAIKSNKLSRLGKAENVSIIAERMVRAVHEIGLTIPEDYR